MANFAVAAGIDTIERANRVMEIYFQEGDKKEDVLNRILDLAENEAVRGTHPELEESLRACDTTIVTLIKQINGIVAGQDVRFAELKEKLNQTLEEKNQALEAAKAKEEAAKKKEDDANTLIKENKEYVFTELKKAKDEIDAVIKERDQARREAEDAKVIAAEKTSNSDLLMKTMKDMEIDLEEYKNLKKTYSNLEVEHNDLKLKLRESELQTEIEVEKAVSNNERALRKEFETEIRNMDKTNIKSQIEIERLNADIDKLNAEIEKLNATVLDLKSKK